MSVATQQPETKSHEIARISQPDADLSTGFLVDTGRFDHLWRVATSFSKSSLVPKEFQRNPDNCFIATQLALRLGVDVYALMQSLYVVHGKPGFEAKFVVGLLNGSGKIRGRVRYELDGEGQDRGCYAWVIDAESGDRIEGPRVDWAMVEAEGWNKDATTRSGEVIRSKWNTMRDLMFHYRAAAFLQRTNYPEVTLGILSKEELGESIVDVEATVTPPKDLDQLTADLTSGNGNDLPTETRSGVKVGYVKAEPPTQPDATEPPPETPRQSDRDATTKPKPTDPRPEYLDALAKETTPSGVGKVRRDWLPRWMTADDSMWAKTKAEERKEQIRPKTDEPAKEPDGESRK